MDTRNFHQAVAKESVDTIITSPPYWNLKNYGAQKKQVGFGQSKDEYMADIQKLLEQWLLMLKPTGSLWLIADNYRKDSEVHLLPWEIADRASKVGWKVRDFVIWDKQYNVPWQQKGQFRNTSEFIVFMTKTDNYKYHSDRIKDLDEISKWWVDFPERFNPKGKTPTNIWSFPIRRRGTWPKPAKVDHYCSLPGTLVGRIIELTTNPGNLVCDPFAGSGVVLAQAQTMGRNYVGCELNPAYVKMFADTKKEVETEWNQLIKRRKKLDSAKLDFEKTVLALRALKFSRVISKIFADDLQYIGNDHIQLLSLASLPKELSHVSEIKLDLIFVVEKSLAKHKKALKDAVAKSNKAPLSHYGIEASVSIIELDKFVFSKKMKKTSKLYLYPAVHVRKSIDCKKAADWLKVLKKKELTSNQKTIPILSNLSVDVEWAVG